MQLYVTLLAALICTMADAQPVYKCTEGGKTVYSDEPCLNASVISVTPTRGLDSSTGRALKGADVQREIRREAIADAIKPITGMNAQQLDRAGRRQKLSVEAQRECTSLDAKLPAANAASAADPTGLFLMRKRYRELRCD